MEILNFPDQEAWRFFLLPGGLLLLVATGMLTLGVPLSLSALSLLFYVACGAGVLLSVRFRSSRACLALLFLFLAQRSIAFFAPARMPALGPGRIAIEVVSVLLPINYLLVSVSVERGLTWRGMARTLSIVFLESIFVAVVCRPGQVRSPAFIRYPFVSPHLLGHGNVLPQIAIVAFAFCLTFLIFRIFRYRRPVEAGFFWSLLAAFIALMEGGVGHIALAYFATSGLAITSALVESSYFLAYHDELTGLPGRRAFNDMRNSLEAPFSIAAVDIDHFKSVNDNYGHDTGDQVLRMVAGKLANVSAGGKAFRVGGEEFAIVFRGKSVAEVCPHLESLRAAIENARFQLRSSPERREAPRSQPDRRAASRKKPPRSLTLMRSWSEDYLSVTVSMGVAEPTSSGQDVSAVYEAADKALYRAKKGGRNRIETAVKSRTRKVRLKSSIA
jgi:diguanylate cyclase (GGDEF)-like protein